ncbi:hypothetical protein KM043_005744 [Ampulex compressa]|nr:hypothetical protein KM043_005744 [Ampulex compressa]
MVSALLSRLLGANRFRSDACRSRREHKERSERSTAMAARRSFDVDIPRLGGQILVFTIILSLATGQEAPRYHGNPSSMMFPEPVGRMNEEADLEDGSTESAESNLAIPLELARKINSMNSIEEFLSLVSGVPDEEKTSIITSRFDDGSERSNAIPASPAPCIPELQPVPLKQDNDTATFYFPSCTRIKRCGGCCSHNLLKCQPITSRTLNFEVLMTAIENSRDLVYKGKVIVPLEEHTSCKCECGIKEHHCTDKQDYIPGECTCRCRNQDEATKCAMNNEAKYWDPKRCTCLCKIVQECTTGFYFDYNTCSCQQVALSKRWFTTSKGTNYKFGQTERPEAPPVVVPLDPTDPRRKPKDDPEY